MHGSSETSGKVKARWLWGGAALAISLVLAAPIVAQRAPTSLLPPGFDEPSAEQDKPEPNRDQPAANPGKAGDTRAPSLDLDLSDIGAASAVAGASDNATDAELTPEELAEQQEKYDLPDNARRSLDLVGPLTPATGGLAADAFGNRSGQFLATLMRETRAPLVSRWGSILLRRALLSATNTPGDIDGADWVAERAWLLVRMGEADPARMMVQSVDADRFTKRLHAVAMQAYLASADPVGLCPYYQRAQGDSESPGWQMAEAICASFSAEQGRASAILNQAERRGRISGIDFRLSEKIVGAGVDARRSVKIEWDGVKMLTAWRFGLATAANVDIPAPLLDRAGPHVRAWQARAPMLSPVSKLSSVQTAARLGVFSGAALVDFYAQLAGSEGVPQVFDDQAEAVRLAYGAPNAEGRIDAMRDLWDESGESDLVNYLLVSRAAAALPVLDVGGADASHVIAAMLSAGYDISAMRWARAAEALASQEGTDGWAMLAVGSPRLAVEIPVDRLRDYVTADGMRGKMALAGLAGLGRIGGEPLNSLLPDAGFSLAPRGQWARAIHLAAQRREKGTVALLAAVGMQVASWSKMPPVHLYHIVSALHEVGLDSEARMIAAEAIMRS